MNHFSLEEDLLFPAILAELGPSPLVTSLVAEHRLMEQMAHSLRVLSSEKALLAFAVLLRTHIRREESELFEQTQGRLSPETMERLGAEFESRAVRVCRSPKRFSTLTTMSTLLQTSLPGIELVARGKVRDVYAIGTDKLLMVATDRISAFDCVLSSPIPDKGRVLTQLSLFWF